MKSAVNPSISVYPLDDCKAVGIDYVELDKTPADVGSSGILSNTQATSTLDSMGSFVTGNKALSKFYSAAPCTGKVQIERTTCDCKLDEQYYVDPSSIDKYDIQCTIKNAGSLSLNCKLSRNQTYIGDSGEVEELGTFEVKDISASPPPEIPDPSLSEISFDLADSKYNIGIKDSKGGVHSVWDDKYFGPYYKELSSTPQPTNEIDPIVQAAGSGGDANSGKFNLACDVYLTDLSDGQVFDCPPIALPAVPFIYHTCDGKSDYWLRCSTWEKSGEDTLYKDGINGQEKIPANVWCCKSWGVLEMDATTGKVKASKKLFDVPSCYMYPAKQPSPGQPTNDADAAERKKYSDLNVNVDDKVIENSLNCAFDASNCLTITADNSAVWKVGDPSRSFKLEKAASSVTWFAGPAEICKVDSSDSSKVIVSAVGSGDCVIKVQSNTKDSNNNEKILEAIYTQSIGKEAKTYPADIDKLEINSKGDEYVKKLNDKVWTAIKSSYEITLPKNSFGVTDASKDVSDAVAKTNPDAFNPKPIDEKQLNRHDGIGKLYWLIFQSQTTNRYRA